MANNKADARKIAREYYLTTDKSQAEIAALVGVNEKTLSEWKIKDSWEMQKAASNIVPRKMIAGFLLQLQKLQEQIDASEQGYPTPAQSDTLMKVSKSIKMLQKELTLSDYISAFEDLTKFGLNINSDLTKQFIQIMNAFVQVKAKEVADA
jgi:DNA-binding XRE family transcriptional regulator